MSSTTALQSFAFQSVDVRVTQDDHGDPWWAASDVASALGYSDGTVTHGISALVEKVPEKWRSKKPFFDGSNNREIIAISEQGLYFFLARSNMPAALPFQEWIAGEVLPSIRRTGRYAVPNLPDPTMMGLPDFTDPLIAARAWCDMLEKNRAADAEVKQLAATVEADRPMVAFAMAVEATDDTIGVGTFAKLVAQNGVDIGQNRLFTWMREKGYIMRDGRNNVPTQASVDAGWLVARESIVVTPSGRSKVTITTKITGKGQLHFMRKLLPETGIVKA